MTDKELINSLKAMKDAPEFGGGFVESDDARLLARLAGELDFETAEMVPASFRIKEYADFVFWYISHTLVRPMTVGLTAFALIFTGWISAVNASFNSVPGDYLYPVKLATERVQLTFAASGKQRAELDIAFAGRRLQEISDIQISNREGKDVRTKAAMEGFTRRIQAANDTLSDLQASNGAAAADLALVIDQKTDEFQDVLNGSDESFEEETKIVAEDALGAVNQANTQAVDAIVDHYEAEAQIQTAETLQRDFQKQYSDIKLRITISHGRIAVIEKVLGDAGGKGDFEDRIAEARAALGGHDNTLSSAMDAFAAGGIRKSFEILREVDNAVAGSEEIILGIEIEISTQVAAETSEDAQSDEEEADEEITSTNF